jgi:hypothetical protein
MTNPAIVDLRQTELAVVNATQFAVSDKLEQLTLPNTVVEIVAWALNYCTALTSFSVPAKVQRIEDGTFFECSALRYLWLHDQLEYIDQNAFYNNVSLTSIIIDSQSQARFERVKNLLPQDLQRFVIPWVVINEWQQMKRDALNLLAEHAARPSGYDLRLFKPFRGEASLVNILREHGLAEISQFLGGAQFIQQAAKSIQQLPLPATTDIADLIIFQGNLNQITDAVDKQSKSYADVARPS